MDHILSSACNKKRHINEEFGGNPPGSGKKQCFQPCDNFMQHDHSMPLSCCEISEQQNSELTFLASIPGPSDMDPNITFLKSSFDEVCAPKCLDGFQPFKDMQSQYETLSCGSGSERQINPTLAFFAHAASQSFVPGSTRSRPNRIYLQSSVVEGGEPTYSDFSSFPSHEHRIVYNKSIDSTSK